MGALRGWLFRLGGLFGTKRRDRDLADEIEAHLEMHIHDNLTSGMAPDEARPASRAAQTGRRRTNQRSVSRPARRSVDRNFATRRPVRACECWVRAWIHRRGGSGTRALESGRRPPSSVLSMLYSSGRCPMRTRANLFCFGRRIHN